MDQRGFEIELVEFMDQKVRADEPPFMVQDISSLDQIAAENLLFMAQEGQLEIVDLIQNVVHEEELQKQQQDDVDFPSNEITTEEVITEDWVEQGEERVEIPVDQIITSQSNAENNEFDVPLPTQQDYYTASRPYPCDFCTRRFRKKNSLMNHMVNFHAGGAEFDTDCKYIYFTYTLFGESLIGKLCAVRRLVTQLYFSYAIALIFSGSVCCLDIVGWFPVLLCTYLIRRYVKFCVLRVGFLLDSC